MGWFFNKKSEIPLLKKYYNDTIIICGDFVYFDKIKNIDITITDVIVDSIFSQISSNSEYLSFSKVDNINDLLLLNDKEFEGMALYTELNKYKKLQSSMNFIRLSDISDIRFYNLKNIKIKHYYMV